MQSKAGSRVRPANLSAPPIQKAESRAKSSLSSSKVRAAPLFSSTHTGPLSDKQLCNALVNAKGTFRKNKQGDDSVVLSKASEIHAKAQAITAHLFVSCNASSGGSNSVPLPYAVLHKPKNKNKSKGQSLIILCAPRNSNYYSILSMRLVDETTHHTIEMTSLAAYDPLLESIGEATKDKIARAIARLELLSIAGRMTIRPGSYVDVSLVEVELKAQPVKGQSAACRVHLETFSTFVNSLATKFFRVRG